MMSARSKRALLFTAVPASWETRSMGAPPLSTSKPAGSTGSGALDANFLKAYKAMALRTRRPTSAPAPPPTAPAMIPASFPSLECSPFAAGVEGDSEGDGDGDEDCHGVKVGLEVY